MFVSKYHHGIRLGELRKFTGNFNQNSGCFVRDDTRSSPRYKLEAMPVVPTCSVSPRRLCERLKTLNCIFTAMFIIYAYPGKWERNYAILSEFTLSVSSLWTPEMANGLQVSLSRINSTTSYVLHCRVFT